MSTMLMTIRITTMTTTKSGSYVADEDHCQDPWAGTLGRSGPSCGRFVPEIGARARIEFRFPEPENLGPEDLEADIYDRALMMLDPA